MIECVFCIKPPPLIKHFNDDKFDVYICTNCRYPDFDTRFRLLYRKGESELLVNTIRIDDFFISCNHKPTTSAKKANYTRIYKDVLGELNGSDDGEPLVLSIKSLICELDFIIKLPWHDPALAIQKLQIYTTFS